MTNKYETVIGLEVHSQLLTKSKMFCSCDSDYQKASPNSRVCPVCMGMPGVLPVINKHAVELVIRTGLALGCEISTLTKFDRKNYPYPDLMKGYQISQFDMPVAESGVLEIVDSSGNKRTIGVTRVHLEEDVAKLVHREETHGDSFSLLDINRAGVPLMEIVSEPDMRTPEEAHSYLTSLHSIIRYIGASTANMEEGSFRCDANISLRPFGSNQLGSKVEIKNVNSFRSVLRALKYEEKRQAVALDKGEKIIQETRGWSDDQDITVPQRTKEYASDYRYFPEPDLPPIKIPRSWVTDIKSDVPELPSAKTKRYMLDLGLSKYDANLLASDIEVAAFFDQIVSEFMNARNGLLKPRCKSAANLINVELSRLINETGLNLGKSNITPYSMSIIVLMLEENKLSSTTAKTLIQEIFENGGDPKVISKNLGLIQVNDASAIDFTIDEVLSENPQAIQEFLSGKDSVLRFLVGQVMKKSKGSANPEIANSSLIEKLETMR